MIQDLKPSAIVTGSTGFIGSHLVDILIDQKWNVIGIDKKFDVPWLNSNCCYKDIDLSLSSSIPILKQIIQTHKIDYVFHLAAIPNIVQTFDEPIIGHNNNLTSTINIIESILNTDVKKIIFSSTSALYKDSNLPIDENNDIDLLTPYGLQKFACENYLKILFQNTSTQVVCLRYFNVFGERMKNTGAYCSVLSTFLKQYREGSDLTITNDGKQTRDFIYVKDVAFANMKVSVSSLDSQFNIFNIGSGVSLTVNELAEFFKKNKVKYIGNRLEIKHSISNPAKIINIGWSPTVTVKDWVLNNIS